MTIKDEIIQVDFNFAPGQMPSFESKMLNPGPYEVQIINGICVEGETAYCTVKVVDSKK